MIVDVDHGLGARSVVDDAAQDIAPWHPLVAGFEVLESFHEGVLPWHGLAVPQLTSVAAVASPTSSIIPGSSSSGASARIRRMTSCP